MAYDAIWVKEDAKAYPRQELHVVVDCSRMTTWLVRHPQITLHPPADPGYTSSRCDTVEELVTAIRTFIETRNDRCHWRHLDRPAPRHAYARLRRTRERRDPAPISPRWTRAHLLEGLEWMRRLA